MAAAGVLRRWAGEELSGERPENNLWLRRDGGFWELGIAIGDGDDASWRLPSRSLAPARLDAGGPHHLHGFDDISTVVGDDGVERHGPDHPAYEVGGFDGVSTIAGQDVRCMTAAFQMGSPTGYAVDDDDWHDVRRLHERFGLPIPADYRRWIATGDEPS